MDVHTESHATRKLLSHMNFVSTHLNTIKTKCALIFFIFVYQTMGQGLSMIKEYKNTCKSASLLHKEGHTCVTIWKSNKQYKVIYCGRSNCDNTSLSSAKPQKIYGCKSY